MVNSAHTPTVDEIARSLGRNHDAQFNRRMPGYADKIRPAAAEPKELPVTQGFVWFLFKLALVGAVCAGVIYLLAVYLGHEISMGGNSDRLTPHQVVIGNDVLSVPENLIRFRSQRYSGDMQRLELHLHWPSLSGYSKSMTASFNNDDKRNSIVFLSIEPREMSIDMAGRIEPIYSKFFDGPALPHEAGLMRQPLMADAGFIDEDLYYEKDSPYPFSARCVRSNSTAGSPYCLRDIHVGKDLMLTYRFHIKHLKDWMMLDTALRNKVNKMLVQ